jgi:hypothetical protein
LLTGNHEQLKNEPTLWEWIMAFLMKSRRREDEKTVGTPYNHGVPTFFTISGLLD